jgi:hypothetical protein
MPRNLGPLPKEEEDQGLLSAILTTLLALMER